MKLYNTLTRHVETIAPLNPPRISVYTCGPTVYDYAHIGHWFNYVRMDTLVRALKLAGYQPTWVMNITDVGHLVSDADEGEDKLEKGARREGKTAWEVAEFYTKDFLDSMKLLNIQTPDYITKATDHIADQIALIKILEDKGFTYTISDGVYFDTSKFEGYAAFARLDLEGIRAGARVEYNSEKHNPTDFALWKFSPPSSEANGDKRRDMEWDSPWGIGFPGWHIECSAMSMKYLGPTLDIHAGGIDHIPVHHTNEIAQSEAATGRRFANYWMHGNHVMVEGEKISKSLGNGIRLQDLVEQGFNPMAVRLYILESHYRSQSQFSLEGLQAAANRLRNWYAVSGLKHQTVDADLVGEHGDNARAADDDVRDPLLDDLNTPQALANIDRRFNEYASRLVTSKTKAAFAGYLAAVDKALGLDLNEQPDIGSAQKALIAEREQARQDKNWQKSDQLREQLADQGIGLRDTAGGAVWYRTG